MGVNFLRRLYRGGFFVLLLSLFYYQIIRGDYFFKRAQKNYIKLIPQRSLRGRILDRNSLVLAYDRASFNIAVIPYQIGRKKEPLLKELAKYSNSPEALLSHNYRKNLENIFSPVDILIDIDKKSALELKERFMEDILINIYPRRFYSCSYPCAHILGYVKEASSFYEDLKPYGYHPRERVGISGVEKYYNNYLKGQEGGDLIEVEASGRIVGFLGKRSCRKGEDIFLTIDRRVQEIAYEALAERKGVIILMETNGELLGLVSSPSFDLNSFVLGKDVSKFLNDPEGPLFNRALQGLYPLGSTFKPFLALVGLEEKKIKPATVFVCSGKITVGKRDFHCLGNHATEDLYEALAHSCNIYFYQLGLILGPEAIIKWIQRFALASLTKIDLPNEKQPPAMYLQEKKWFAGDILNLSIGQAELEVTPLALIVALNALANGGYLVRPYLLKKVGDKEMNISAKSSLIISEENLKIIKRALLDVVNRPGGTASRLKSLDLRIAGKTGTAQTKNRPAHGWFVGFFPYQKPKYSFLVFLENAGSSQVAVETAYQFLKRLKDENLLALE